jgi:hypothetical protein
MIKRAAMAWIAGLAVVVSASAGTYNWTFQEAGASTGGGRVAGLAMKTGDTWPVVFGQGQTFGNMAGAFSLKPAGWVATSFNAPVYTSSSSGMKAESAPNGQVASVWTSGPATVEYAQTSPNGWLRSTFVKASTGIGTPDLAFRSNSAPVVAYTDLGRMNLMSYGPTGWDKVQINELRDPATGQTISPSANQVSVAVESQNGVCLAYAYNTTVGFAFQDSATGTWYGKPISTSPTWSSVTDISLAFGLNDQAGMAFLSNDSLYYSSFDPRTGTWVTDFVAGAVQSDRINLAFDQAGNPALAYTSQGTVRFTTKVGYGWANYMLPTGGTPYAPSSDSDAALAFDANNLPVIAYNSTGGKLVLAYDPVLTPEPVCLSLMLVAAAIVVRPRRKA